MPAKRRVSLDASRGVTAGFSTEAAAAAAAADEWWERMKTYGRRSGEATKRVTLQQGGLLAEEAGRGTTKRGRRRITDFFFKKLSAEPEEGQGFIEGERVAGGAGSWPALEASLRGSGKKAAGGVQTFLNISRRASWMEPCECGFLCDQLYPPDSVRHCAFHSRQLGPLVRATAKYERHAGWRELYPSGDMILKVSGRSRGGRAIQTLANCINELMEAARQEPGELARHEFYLYLRDDTVVGFMGAEEGGVAKAHLQDPEASKAVAGGHWPVSVGVSRIWVAREQRRRGIASRLLSSIRRCCHTAAVQCTSGCLVPRDQVAFSHPTQLGRQLAAAHLQRPDGKFLLYDVGNAS